MHFYGFHSSYSPFLKVLLADPAYMNRAATIMQSGTVMGMPFRVYESHINFILQFLCDFGLYGCGWMDLGEVFQRAGESAADLHANNDANDPVFPPSPYFRQSRMSLEVDVAAHQILNRLNLTARNLHHELVIPAPPAPDEPLVLSVRELWEDERRRRAAKGLNPSPDLPVDPSARSRSAGGEWVAEARYWQGLRERIEQEREQENVTEPKETWERWVMTTFESIEALWEEEWKTWKPARQVKLQEKNQPEEDEEQAGSNPFGTAVGQPSQDSEASASGHHELDGEVEVDEVFLASQSMRKLVQSAEEPIVDEQDLGEAGDAENFQEQEEENHLSHAFAGVDEMYAAVDSPREDAQLSQQKDSAPAAAQSPAQTPTKASLKRPNPFIMAYGKMAR